MSKNICDLRVGKGCLKLTFYIRLCIKIDKIHKGVRGSRVMTELQKQNKQQEVQLWSAGGISLQLSIYPAFFVLWMRSGLKKEFYIQENSSCCHRNVHHLLQGNSPSWPTPRTFRTQARIYPSTTDVILLDRAFSKPRASEICQVLCSCFHQSIKLTQFL